MMSFFDVTNLLGGIIQALGLLVFGAAAGWFTLFTLRQPERHWQLQAAVYLGFFFFTALLAKFSYAAGLGAFGLGAGGAILFWGLQEKAAAEDESPPDEE
ncbi:MAG: hypothetical protein U9Q82_06730 [Chloroflexota bacterium]|nr:hypothetical protein [Chloroflexota bacterium]